MKLKFLLSFALAGALSAGLSSCSDDDDAGYKGENNLSMKVKTVSTITDRANATLDIELSLTLALDKDLTVTLKLEDNTVEGEELVKLKKNPIIIPSGEKTALITVEANETGVLESNTNIKVAFESVSDQTVKAGSPVTITVKPKAEGPELTQQQKALIKGYADNYGLDLMQWIGAAPVEVTVNVPGDSSLEYFTDPRTFDLSGEVVITLSENATATKPVLAMTSNAMGLEDFLYDVFRRITIWDEEYWTTEGGSGLGTMELVGLTADSNETFGLALDNIILSTTSNEIAYVTEGIINVYDEKITAVDFIYSYSAWDRMKELIDAGNEEAIELYEMGGSIDPAHHFNISGIDQDEWTGSYWIEPTGEYDQSEGTMKFVFPMDFNNANDYMRIYVTINAFQ